MRNNGYNASLYRMMKGKKIARAPTIHKPILKRQTHPMPTIIILPPFFVL